MHGLMSGKVLKEFRGHSAFVNHAVYSPDGALVVTAGSEGVIKVPSPAPRSPPPIPARALREPRRAANEAGVLSAYFPASVPLRCSSGGWEALHPTPGCLWLCVQVWDFKTAECVRSFEVPQPTLLVECAVNSVSFLPRHRDQLLVSNRTNSLYVMSLTGEVRCWWW